MKRVIIIVLLSVLLGCTKVTAPPPVTAPTVNINKYMGKWYEIAAFPMFFEKGCYCTEANYSLLSDNTVKVTNQCRRDQPTNKWSIANASAWAANAGDNSKLKVRFFWPFTADYWVLYVDNDYNYAIVGSPNYEYLWILSRQPQISDTQYQKLLTIATQKGYDVKHLKLTPQLNCPR